MTQAEIRTHQMETCLDLIRVAVKNHDLYRPEMTEPHARELAEATLGLIRAALRSDEVCAQDQRSEVRA